MQYPHPAQHLHPHLYPFFNLKMRWSYAYLLVVKADISLYSKPYPRNYLICLIGGDVPNWRLNFNRKINILESFIFYSCIWLWNLLFALLFFSSQPSAHMLMWLVQDNPPAILVMPTTIVIMKVKILSALVVVMAYGWLWSYLIAK